MQEAFDALFVLAVCAGLTLVGVILIAAWKGWQNQKRRRHMPGED